MLGVFGKLLAKVPTAKKVAFKKMQQQMDLLTVVSEPTWKELLIDLVASKKMDPWEVDLSVLADGYLQVVRQLQALDLRVPANVILACALLLKFKSETLRLEEEPIIEEEYYEERSLIDEEIPELVYRPDQARKRHLTLDELVTAVEQVMKERPSTGLKIPVPKTLEINFPRIDTGELIETIYSEAFKMKDSSQLVLFSSLVDSLKKYHEPGTLEQNAVGQSLTLELQKVPLSTVGEAKAFYFVPVLHLVQQNKAIIWQEECFSEIFLKVLDPQQTAERMAGDGGAAAEQAKEDAEIKVEQQNAKPFRGRRAKETTAKKEKNATEKAAIEAVA